MSNINGKMLSLGGPDPEQIGNGTEQGYIIAAVVCCHKPHNILDMAVSQNPKDVCLTCKSAANAI